MALIEWNGCVSITAIINSWHNRLVIHNNENNLQIQLTSTPDDSIKNQHRFPLSLSMSLSLADDRARVHKIGLVCTKRSKGKLRFERTKLRRRNKFIQIGRCRCGYISVVGRFQQLYLNAIQAHINVIHYFNRQKSSLLSVRASCNFLYILTANIVHWAYGYT